MRLTWPLVLALAACDGDGADWDGAISDFEDGLCTSPCSAMTEDACRRDVQTDLADAKAMLDDAGQQRCIDCLDTRLRLFPLVEMQGCQPTAAQDAEITAACGAEDEACAGFP